VRCYSCNGAELIWERTTVPFDALPSIQLADVQVESCPSCGEQFTSLPAPRPLAILIAERVLLKRARLTAAELQFVRSVLGMSSSEFARTLRVPAAAVEQWDAGSEPVPPDTELLCRFVVAAELGVAAFVDRYHTVATGEPSPLEGGAEYRKRWYLTAWARTSEAETGEERLEEEHAT